MMTGMYNENITRENVKKTCKNRGHGFAKVFVGFGCFCVCS